MENEVQPTENKNKGNYILPAAILIAAIVIGGALIYTAKPKTPENSTDKSGSTEKNQESTIDENSIIPPEGAELSVEWGDLGAQLVKNGVIDSQKFEAIYSDRGGLDEEMKKILYSSDNGKIKMTPQNAGFLLNMFWALGLANKNPILEKGPMSDPQYGGAGNFASTGGWTIAKGDAMEHYSKYNFITLTPEQQALVEKVSQGIYRPCCNNSTYFPDCNHGMAMLGLLELMASQGMAEDEMYKIALKVNAYWFPDTYLTIAKYFKEKENIDWEKVDPKKALGVDFSSGSGYQSVLSKVSPVQPKGGGGCGV